MWCGRGWRTSFSPQRCAMSHGILATRESRWRTRAPYAAKTAARATAAAHGGLFVDVGFVAGVIVVCVLLHLLLAAARTTAAARLIPL